MTVLYAMMHSFTEIFPHGNALEVARHYKKLMYS